jgi:hypothetical protein
VIHSEVLIPSPLISKLQNALKCLPVPFLFLVAFYMYHARGMTIGGGDTNDPFTEISKGIAYVVGLPDGFFLWRATASGLFILITFGRCVLIH